MNKTTTTALSLCLLAAGISLPIAAQEKAINARASVAAAGSDRLQDGLNGPVRRVRLETAQIQVKDGKSVEGPRQLRGIATYDPRGRKIDTVAYPAEGDSLTGKEQYRYDEKGNITEMVVLDADGTVLSKETYTYEFDSLGNWKKMVTSVALYENGSVSYEPIEVSYRTLAYYYGAVEKFESASKTSASSTTNTRDTKVEESASPVNVPVASRVSEGPAKDAAVKESSPAIRSDRQDNGVAAGPNLADVAAKRPEVSNPAMAMNETLSVKPSSEEERKNAAVNPSARAVSATPPEPKAAVTTSAGNAAANPLEKPAVITPEKDTVVAPPKRSETMLAKIGATEPALASAATETPKRDATSLNQTLYQTGLRFIAEGEYDGAVEVLNQHVRLNPNDASGYAKLGLAYSRLHKHKEAIVVLTTAMRLRAEVVDAEAYYQLGYSYGELGKHRDAVEAFKKSLFASRQEAIDNNEAKEHRLAPSYIYYGLGLAYHNLKLYPEAIKELSEAVKLDPQFAQAHYGLGLAYLARSDRWSARREQKALVALNATLGNQLADAIANMSFRENIPCAAAGTAFCR